jgi:hypothetical protein
MIHVGVDFLIGCPLMAEPAVKISIMIPPANFPWQTNRHVTVSTQTPSHITRVAGNRDRNP